MKFDTTQNNHTLGIWGCTINEDDNDTEWVHRGDLLTCDVAMTTYMVNDNFGCKFVLKGVTILKKGLGGSQKPATNWSALMK